MKKLFVLCLSAVIACAAVAGCSSSNTKAPSKTEETKIAQGFEKFEGKIETVWADVKEEFEKIEEQAKSDVTNAEKIEKKDIQSAVKIIETNYEKVKEGITEETEKYAKEMYKTGQKLESLGEKAQSAANHDIVQFGKDTKALVKHLYGEAEADYSKVKGDFETGLNDIQNYSEEKWNEFETLLK